MISFVEARVDEAPYALARPLEGGGRGLAQGMHAAMHVGVGMGLVVFHRAQNRQRTLRGGGAVEVDERLAVDGAGEDREVTSHALRIVRRQRLCKLYVGGHHRSSLRVSSRSWPATCSSICRRSAGTVDLRDHVLEERPLEQALRRVACQAARQQIEQHVLIELAGRSAVAAAHLIGVDLQLRPQVDLRFRTGEQSAQRLLRIGAWRAFSAPRSCR